MHTFSIVALALPLGLCGCGGAPPASDVDDPMLQLTAELDPDPPRVARHTMTLHVEDLDGSPVQGANVTAHAEMPLHAHPSNEDARITEEEPGEYRVSPLTFTMPGRWQVHVVVAVDEGETQHDFTYEVE